MRERSAGRTMPMVAAVETEMEGPVIELRIIQAPAPVSATPHAGTVPRQAPTPLYLPEHAEEEFCEPPVRRSGR